MNDRFLSHMSFFIWGTFRWIQFAVAAADDDVGLSGLTTSWLADIQVKRPKIRKAINARVFLDENSKKRV